MNLITHSVGRLASTSTSIVVASKQPNTIERNDPSQSGFTRTATLTINCPFVANDLPITSINDQDGSRKCSLFLCL
jgi:hypothetical protein